MNIIDDDENFPYGDQDVSDDEDVEDGAANDDSDDDPNNYNRYPNYDEYNERRRGYRAQRKELRRRSASPVLNPARLRYPEINTGKRNDNCGSVTIAALASDGKAGTTEEINQVIAAQYPEDADLDGMVNMDRNLEYAQAVGESRGWGFEKAADIGVGTSSNLEGHGVPQDTMFGVQYGQGEGQPNHSVIGYYHAGDDEEDDFIKYTDFQHHRQGVDVTDDVQQSPVRNAYWYSKDSQEEVEDEGLEEEDYSPEERPPEEDDGLEEGDYLPEEDFDQNQETEWY